MHFPSADYLTLEIKSNSTLNIIKKKKNEVASRKGEKEIKANWKYKYQIVIENNDFFHFQIIHFLAH